MAIVTDRGCDRLRFYAIDPGDTASPLTDITAPDVPRVFPLRLVQPSPLQPSDVPAGLQGNPLDDQDTAYGIGLWRREDALYAFVSQRNRSVVSQLRILPMADGQLSYYKIRTFVFNPTFRLPDEDGALVWTPCREEADHDPQSEGIVVDQRRSVLYVGVETIGLYAVRLGHHLGKHVMVGRESLLEPVKFFGDPYWAVPDNDEFECAYDPEGTPQPDTIVANGSTAFGGRHLEADLEGLAIYYRGHGGGYLIASSPGDSTFQVFMRTGSNRHVASFQVDGVEDTDGLDITSVSLGSAYPSGLLAVHNGKAPAPADTSDINGYEYDNSTQFKFVS
ncbi:MAG: phytase [Gammaproteobacteria bacterium]